MIRSANDTASDLWSTRQEVFSMARGHRIALRLLALLLILFLVLTPSTLAGDGEPVGIVRATIEREEGPPCECEGVMFADGIAERLGNRLGFEAEGTIEGRCESAPSDDPEIVETFCFAGIYGEGRMEGTYSGANDFGLVRGAWEAEYDAEALETTSMSQAFARGAGPGGPKNRGESTQGWIDWTQRPTRDEVEEALECSRFLREVFGSIIWPDPRGDLVFHTPPPLGVPVIDVRRIVQDQGSLVLTIEPFGRVPPRPETSLRYQVYFDVDRRPDTGIPIRDDLGAEFTVWIGYNAPFGPDRWAAVLFQAHEGGGFTEIGPLPEGSWEIGASRIRLTIPLLAMGDPPALHWLWTTSNGTAADTAPNDAVGFWWDAEAL